jgi:hypothetical protein
MLFLPFLLGALPAEAGLLPRPAFLQARDYSTCPDIWYTISADLTNAFLTDGVCNQIARGAIRYAFHDAGPFSSSLPFVAPAGGGSDGSLLLSADEILRPENAGLRPFHAWVTAKWAEYRDQGVGAADFIQFAGNHATVTCPGGPTIKTLVGREDTSSPSATGQLPPGFGPGSDHDSLLRVFQDKGFSAADLAALIGAHTVSTNIAQTRIPVGNPQDSTPGVWDVRYYRETYEPPAGVSRFDSDINLSNTTTAVGEVFASFVGNQVLWKAAYADAMFRLSVLGIPQDDLAQFVDCTSALPAETPIGSGDCKKHKRGVAQE